MMRKRMTFEPGTISCTLKATSDGTALSLLPAMSVSLRLELGQIAGQRLQIPIRHHAKRSSGMRRIAKELAIKSKALGVDLGSSAGDQAAHGGVLVDVSGEKTRHEWVEKKKPRDAAKKLARRLRQKAEKRR